MTTPSSSPSKINEGRKLFGKILRLRSLSWESNSLLVRNPSQVNLAGFMSAIGGLLMIFGKPENSNALLWILGGIILIALGAFLVLGFKAYSVYNLSNNVFYNEFRMASTTLFRSKAVDLANIVQLGVDHKRQKSMTSNMASQSRFIFRIYSQLVGEADVRTKDASLIDGTVEHTALVF